MKKFIAVFDGLGFKESTLQYAVSLAKGGNVHLVGVFLEDFTRHSYSFRQLATYEGEDREGYLHKLNERDNDQREESIQKFQQACETAELNFSIHRDRNIALQELLEESIYADLLIINACETVNRFHEEPPSRFIRDLLVDVQCPVLLVPESYHYFNRIVLLYDGEPSSVYAAKAFSYVFENYNYYETVVLTVKSEDAAIRLPNGWLVREFVRRHYPKAEYVVIKGEPEEEIVFYLQREKKSPLIVLGAYQRGRLSRLFRASMADRLLKHVKAPLFIAHNKS